ncbi:MAG: YceI family protein, partial [Casimicrobiaceae bacterium]
SSVRSLGLNRYVATGMLRLKGVEQPVEVPFAWTDAGDGATMEGRFTIKRAPYGIGVGEWASTKVIGPDVTVKFSITLREHA